MATDRLVSAAAYGDRYDKPISGVLNHHRGHDPGSLGGWKADRLLQAKRSLSAADGQSR